MFKNTLDVDISDKKVIERTWIKIMLCKGVRSIEIFPSSFKGYHLILHCYRECDICRMVYDDFRRFAYDQNRPKHARNILFQEKEVIRLRL